MVNYFEFSREDSLKINYGLTILIVNLSKALAIYLSAIIFGGFWKRFYLMLLFAF